jgi:hypothetical protein
MFQYAPHILHAKRVIVDEAAYFVLVRVDPYLAPGVAGLTGDGVLE